MTIDRRRLRGLARGAAISARHVLGERRRRSLRRVETQAVEMELADPVARVADEELAHRRELGPSN